MTDPIETHEIAPTQALDPADQTHEERVRAEAKAADGSVQVELISRNGSATVTVPPSGSWPISAVSAMRNGDFVEWARDVLDFDDFEVFATLNPTLDEAAEFFRRWGRATGQRTGESRASRR